MRKNYFYAIMAAMLTVSCSQQDELMTEQQRVADANAIGFSVSMATTGAADTRAEGETTIDELKATVDGFGVFAAYTGINRYGDATVTPDFMYNQPVRWDNANDVWSYNPVKYWPNGEGLDGENKHYVSFFGYAPYSDMNGTDPATNPAGYCISGFSQAHAQGDPWLTYRLIPQDYLDKQVDLLYAKQLDMTKPAAGAKVEFAFEHALACVGDKITIQASDVLKNELKDLAGTANKVDLVIAGVDITYTLAEKGRLVLWNSEGAANWQPVLSENLTTERVPIMSGTLPKTIYSYEAATAAESKPGWFDKGNGVFFIPLSSDVIAQKATVSIRYEIVVNDSFVYNSKEVTRDMNIGHLAEAGKRVDLKIFIGEGSTDDVVDEN